MSGTNIFDDAAVGVAASTAIGSGQTLTIQHMQGLANQQFNNAYNQMLAAQQQQLGAYNLARQKHEWMVNGQTMTFDEFLDTICPDEDDPHRTFLMLKYKGIK